MTGAIAILAIATLCAALLWAVVIGGTR